MAITSSTPSPSPTGTSAGEAAGANIFGAQVASPSGASTVWMPGQPGTTGLSNKDLGALSESAQAKLNQRPSGQWMTIDDATNAYYSWTQKQRDDFRAKALVGGLLKFGDGDVEASTLWGKLVQQAGNYGAQNIPMSPMDLLAGYVKQNSAGGQWVKQGNFETNALTGETRYVGPQFKTTTASNINLTDPATAKALATSIFQQLLGRDPASGELSSYADALNQAEVQNPSQQTTTTQYDMTTGQATNTSSVTSGGLTDAARQQLAEDEIKKKPEYATNQAATTYMNAFEQAVYGAHG